MVTTIHENTLLRCGIPPDDWEHTPESVQRALQKILDENEAMAAKGSSINKGIKFLAGAAE